MQRDGDTLIESGKYKGRGTPTEREENWTEYTGTQEQRERKKKREKAHTYRRRVKKF